MAGASGRKRPSESWLADDQNFAIALAKMGPESKSSFKREVEKIDGMLAPSSLPWTREMIRAGDLLSLLKEDELFHARNRGINDFSESIMDQVDEDEQFYMTAMASVIGTCDKPYYARVDTIDKVMLDVEQLDDDTRSAWMATNVLLGHVADGLYWQGHDRALAEAWLIALTAAATGEQPPERKNPLTGFPYHVKINELNVAVSGISDREGGWYIPEPLVVPRLAQVAIRGRHLR